MAYITTENMGMPLVWDNVDIQGLCRIAPALIGCGLWRDGTTCHLQQHSEGAGPSTCPNSTVKLAMVVDVWVSQHPGVNPIPPTVCQGVAQHRGDALPFSPFTTCCSEKAVPELGMGTGCKTQERGLCTFLDNRVELC